MGAEVPSISPDVLIVESTYGTQDHMGKEEREERFTGAVQVSAGIMAPFSFAPASPSSSSTTPHARTLCSRTKAAA